MTPTYQNSSAPSPFHLAASSSSSSHNFLYSTTHDQQDQSGYYHKELQQPQIIQQDQADNFASHGGGSYDIENESSDNGLKFSIWKKEDKYANHQETNNNYHVKWMSSKMRLMHKMKNVGRTAAVNAPPTTTSLLKLEDQKQQPSSSPMETENSSNSSSNNSNSPIRVCSDCNTAKTPLWRSGPQGPKSLCNACGIRQRKARRAMAAAAAANGTTIQTETTPVLLKTTKTQQKDKRSSTTTGHVAKYKKRSTKLQPATNNNSSHQAKKKLCFEDFLVSLSKNLAFHRVFPQDEKEAAILLMALSCGHVRG